MVHYLSIAPSSDDYPARLTNLKYSIILLHSKEVFMRVKSKTIHDFSIIAFALAIISGFVTAICLMNRGAGDPYFPHSIKFVGTTAIVTCLVSGLVAFLLMCWSDGGEGGGEEQEISE